MQNKKSLFSCICINKKKKQQKKEHQNQQLSQNQQPVELIQQNQNNQNEEKHQKDQILVDCPKIKITSSYKKEDLEYRDFIEDTKEKKIFKYTCPLCLRSFTCKLPKTNCCEHYICHFCAEDLNEKYEEKNINSHCFWCNTENLEVYDVNKANPIKRYSDSPNSTIKLNETISNNLQNLLKSIKSNQSHQNINLQFQTQLLEKRLNQLQTFNNKKLSATFTLQNHHQHNSEQNQDNVKSLENFELIDEEEIEVSQHKFNKFIFQTSKFIVQIHNYDKSTHEKNSEMELDSDSINDRSMNGLSMKNISFGEMQQAFQEPNIEQSQLIIQNSSMNL